MVFLNCFEFIHVDFFCFAAAQLARQFVCLFVCWYKTPKILISPPSLGLR